MCVLKLFIPNFKLLEAYVRKTRFKMSLSLESDVLTSVVSYISKCVFLF